MEQLKAVILAAGKGTVHAPGRAEPPGHHHGERRRKAESPSGTGRGTETVHLRATDRNRILTKSTTYI